MDGYTGTIILFAGLTVPDNWMLCEGQILYINSNPVLYSLIGNIYGGDGQTTFALPDLRDITPKPAKGSAWMNYLICVIGNYPTST